jgi:Cu/Zn superoxide dismutase
MKNLAIAALAMLGLCTTGCGSNSTAPTNAPTIFTVQLSPANEVPAITNAEATGKGTAVITITTTKDSSGNVTGGTVDFNVSLSNFPNGSSAILSHIHGPNAPAGSTAGVFVDTGLTAGTAIPMPAGSATFTLRAPSATAAQISQILANPSQFYFNVHTPLNPGGAIRAQLQ